MNSPAIPTKFQADISAQRCFALRRRILDMSQKVSALHIAGAFSCLEIVATIYFDLMRRASDEHLGDTFVLSKGHGCLAQYTSLEMLGVLSQKDLDLYCKAEGRLGTHPDYGVPGIEASTGSLGHGLVMAVGMAHADKVLGHDRCVYTVLSDGEIQEGSTWEALMLAPSLKLNNLVAIVDYNDYQSMERTSVSYPHLFPLHDKLRLFGWETALVNGHCAEDLYQAVKQRKNSAPFLVVAQTTKGKGVSYMENVPIWHYRSPNADEYQRAVTELKEIYR